MNQVKAFQILASLNNGEFKKFGQFLKSSFFNRSTDLIKVFNFIKPYHPVFTHPKLTYENIYRKVYPGKKFNLGTIRNLLSELGNLSEKFLGYVEYEEGFWYKYNVLLGLKDRNLEKFFLKYFNGIKIEENKKTDTQGAKSLFKYLYENEAENFEIIHSDDISASHQNSSSEALLTFLLKVFFGRQASWMARQFNYNSPFENNIVRDFFANTNVGALINSLEQNNSDDWKRLRLFYYLNSALENKDNDFKDYLYKAWDLFQSAEIEMTRPIKFDTYVRFSNIINTHGTADDFPLKRLSFEIKKEMVEKGITSEMFGPMRVMEYLTVTEAALNVKEIDWADDFIEKKKNSVEEGARDDAYNFYKSRVLFFRKKFAESNEYLSKVNQESIMLKIDIKVQRMQNFYELNYLDSAHSQVQAFKQFLKNSDTLSPRRRDSYSNFQKFYFRLLNEKSGKKQDMQLLIKELSECQKIRNKPWLLEKAKKLT